MATVMLRDFRALALFRKAFSRNELRFTGAPEPATERRTAAAVTVPSWLHHWGRQAHLGDQSPGRGACHPAP
jgi:hypothetical protein